MKFLHSMIRSFDINKSMKFYTELLGLKLSYKANLEDCTLYYLKDEVTGVEIELTENFEKPENKYVNGEAFGHFAFEVNDFEKFTKKMNELGYKYLYEPFDIVLKGENDVKKMKIAFLEDPDGNEIEIIQN